MLNVLVLTGVVTVTILAVLAGQDRRGISPSNPAWQVHSFPFGDKVAQLELKHDWSVRECADTVILVSMSGMHRCPLPLVAQSKGQKLPNEYFFIVLPNGTAVTGRRSLDAVNNWKSLYWESEDWPLSLIDGYDQIVTSGFFREPDFFTLVFHDAVEGSLDFQHVRDSVKIRDR